MIIDEKARLRDDFVGPEINDKVPYFKNGEVPLDYIMQDDYEIADVESYEEDEIRVGMRVHTGQLKNIYRKHIVIANPIMINTNRSTQFAGTIVYIGMDNGDAFIKAWELYTINKGRPCHVFNHKKERVVCKAEKYRVKK